MNMQRTTAACLCLAVLLAASGARAQYGEAADVAETELGRGIWLGPVNISPFLNVSGLYDSNIDFVRKGEEENHPKKDTRGYRIQPGVDLTRPGVGWGLDGRGYYQVEEYSADFAESRKDWSEMLGLHAETERGLGVRLSELVQHVSHTDQSWEDRWNDRTEARIRGDVGGPLTEKSSLSVDGTYADLSYQDSDLYDWSRWGGGLTFSHKASDKTDGLLVSGFDVHESDGQDGSAESVNLMAGFASRATEKTGYRATFGVEHYSGFENDNARTGFAYDMGATWHASERLSAMLSGSSHFAPAEDVSNNSMLESTVGVGLRYRPLTRWEFSLNGAYRREDYSNPIEVSDSMLLSDSQGSGGESRTDHQLSGEVRAVYGISQYTSVYAGYVYTHTVSTIDDFDYDRWRVSAGLALRY